MLAKETVAGSLVWDQDVDSERVYVKCKDDTWAAFSELNLHGLGKCDAKKLVQKLLKKKRSKTVVTEDGSHRHKFNFQ